MTHTAQALPVFTLLVLAEHGWMDAAANPPQEWSLAAKGKQEWVCRQPVSQCLPRCSGSPTSVQRVSLYFCYMSLMSSWVPAAGGMGTGTASPPSSASSDARVCLGERLPLENTAEDPGLPQ